MSGKVGIITLYEDNFGSILQAFSTYKYIESLGLECDILNINSYSNIFNKILKIPSILHKCLRYRDYFNDRRNIRVISQKERKLLSQNTKNRMNQFVNDVFRIKMVNIFELDHINNNYDFFLTGSDQVWNGYYDYRFLRFADKEKRIAFAPSFGGGVKDYYRKEIKRGIEGFDVLSIREESGIQIIKELTGRDAVRLADPTLLLSKEEWENFAKHGMKRSNYILLHFLNKPSSLAIATINSYLKEHNCFLYGICNKYADYDQFNKYEFLDIDPIDYVSLVKNADFVFTDSFHSTLFSLNLETAFLTFERQYLHGNPQSSRIIDLLNRVNMQEHFIRYNIQFELDENKQWDSELLFSDERKELKDYLKKALKI